MALLCRCSAAWARLVGPRAAAPACPLLVRARPALRHAPAPLRHSPQSVTRGRMLSAIKRALGGGGAAAAAAEAGCAGCDPAILATCKVSPEDLVGTVTPHAAHVFIKLAAPAGAAADATDEAWWPESVDQQPAIVAANEAIKAAGDAMPGKVKVTAFDTLTTSSPEPGTADVYVFPAGLYIRGVPLEDLPSVLVAALQGGAPSADAFEAAEVPGITLFVCCHAARDARCGHIGPPLAARLAALAEARGLGGSLRVLKTSHVGGHAYAGNVLAYCRGRSIDGDWFGGVHPGNAEEFFEALVAAKAPSGAAGDAALRRWWRGRVGLSKQEQVAYHQAALKDIEDLK